MRVAVSFLICRQSFLNREIGENSAKAMVFMFGQKNITQIVPKIDFRQRKITL
jgi:hypothetical protein